MDRRANVDVGARRVCELVGSLDVPVPWDLDNFIGAIASMRGKPIQLIGQPGLASAGHPCGIWIGRATDDIVIFDSSASGYHRGQIILHEIGHLLLEHGGADSSSQEALSMHDLMPDIDRDTIVHVLGRSAYDNDQESQAELFASLMMAEAHRQPPDSLFLSSFLRG
jgi:hypothetical protein